MAGTNGLRSNMSATAMPSTGIRKRSRLLVRTVGSSGSSRRMCWMTLGLPREIALSQTTRLGQCSVWWAVAGRVLAFKVT